MSDSPFNTTSGDGFVTFPLNNSTPAETVSTERWQELQLADLRAEVDRWRAEADTLARARDAAVRDGQNMMLDYRESRDRWKRRAEMAEAVVSVLEAELRTAKEGDD